MQETFRKTAPKLALWLFLMFGPVTAFAAGETFKGLLIPQSFDPPIPIIVDLTISYGRFLGRVKTSSPLIGEGPITSGEKQGNACNLTSHIGSGVRLRLEGNCMPTAIQGQYRIYFPDGRRVQGNFKLNSVTLNKGKKELSESEHSRLSSATTTACLKTNSACLAGCPRGTDNDEGTCANMCTRKFAACKAKLKKLPEIPDARGY